MDWYNRYRPRKFEAMYVTSPFIAKLPLLVKDALAGGHKLAHAMLFHSTMPGLGKTTTGRVLASELNPGISDEEREAIFHGHSDSLFIEINAGDKGKKDDARELRERVKSLRFGMHDWRYVIMVNEAHQYTSDAQQVLLDLCTEDIPENVYFLLTSTNISKLRDDLLSRLERHSFKPLDVNETRRLLEDIAVRENHNTVEDRVVQHIFTVSEGSPRIAVRMLQQFLTTGELVSDVRTEDDDESWKEIYLLVRAFENTVNGASWTNDVAPAAGKVMNSLQPEEARQRILEIIGKTLTTATVLTTVMPVYRALSERLVEPIAANRRGEFITRLFLASTDIRDFLRKGSGEESAPAPVQKRKAQTL